MNKTDTSRAAAEDMELKAATIRDAVLAQLKWMPMTTDETAKRLGIDKLAVRPRFSELRETGKIFDTGYRRYNESGKLAIVWDVV